MTVAVVKDDSDRGWREDAACREREPGWFFPEGEWSASLAQIDAAKAVCVTCRVRRECLAYAYRTNRCGIWGGLTQDERRNLASILTPIA